MSSATVSTIRHSNAHGDARAKAVAGRMMARELLTLTSPADLAAYLHDQTSMNSEQIVGSIRAAAEDGIVLIDNGKALNARAWEITCEDGTFTVVHESGYLTDWPGPGQDASPAGPALRARPVLQRRAWQWAQANRGPDGSLSAGMGWRWRGVSAAVIGGVGWSSCRAGQLTAEADMGA